MSNTITKPKAGNPLLTAPIPLMMRQLGVPVAVGATFTTLYNIVDTIYGGTISDVALAALSLSFPIYFILIALGFGFSQGGTALIGNALGEKKVEEAQAFAVQGVIFGILISIVATIAVVLSASSLLSFMGAAEGTTLAPARGYITTIFYGSIFFITVQMLIGILNAIGRTKPGRNFQAAGFFLNLGLNPWFIFGGFGVPAMGIVGIAVATVVVQALGCIYIAWEVSKIRFDYLGERAQQPKDFPQTPDRYY